MFVSLANANPGADTPPLELRYGTVPAMAVVEIVSRCVPEVAKPIVLVPDLYIPVVVSVENANEGAAAEPSLAANTPPNFALPAATCKAHAVVAPPGAFSI